MPRKNDYPNYWKRAYQLQKQFDQKLLDKDIQTINQITKRYLDLIHTLDDKIDKLAGLKELSLNQLRLNEVYKDYIRDLTRRMESFGVYNANLISVKQGEYIQLGLFATQSELSLISVNFQKLNVSALEWMIGNSMEGGRLYDLLVKSYPETVDKITKTLIESVAMGRNPVTTARLIKVDMAGNLSRALRISRTETIMSYRESSRQQMITSGLVSEYERIEQPDCCSKCDEVNHKRYPLDTIFETHPNCRGTLIPVVPED